MSDTPAPYKPRCIYLTCKSMVVYGEDFQDDPDFQAGMVDFQCLQTCKNFGPDGDEVALEICSKPERGCFQEY